MSDVPAVPTSATGLSVFEKEMDIALLEGEEILYAGRPQTGGLRTYLTLAWSMLSVLTVIGIPALPFVWWMAGAFTKKHRYWLTSRRVVVTTGVIGYRTRSVPLERVSDVAVSCSWLERLLGLRSVVIRDMTGEAQGGAGMLAVDDASAIQRQILEQVHTANRTLPGEDARPMLAAPYREDQTPAQDQMLHLLQQIEKNTRDK
jgi:uncharacterized membrane protein YdbT with pleckstrin-like domain